MSLCNSRMSSAVTLTFKLKSTRYAVAKYKPKSDVELAGIWIGAVRFVEAQEHIGLIPITSVNHLAVVVVGRSSGTGARYAA